MRTRAPRSTRPATEMLRTSSAHEEAIEHYTDSKSVVIATETHSEMVGGE